MSALLFGTMALCGPACSADSRPPSLVNLGAALPSEGGQTGSSAAGSANQSGASNGDSDAGEAGAAGALDIDRSIGEPATPPECNEPPSWSGAASVAGISTEANETLLAITPDELDLAFQRDDSLFVAHRSSPAARFSPGAALTIPAGWSAEHGVALSADGLRLVLVSDPDQNQLGELTRSSRDETFSTTVDTSVYLVINQESGFTRRVYAWPSISSGDDQLFFSSSLDASSTIMVSSRSGNGAFGAPKAVGSGILDGSGGKRLLPTGISSDGRTLFYFNEESGEEEARWRASSSAASPLYDMRSLGARRGAAPNSGCNRLYSTAHGDIVVEKD